MAYYRELLKTDLVLTLIKCSIATGLSIFALTWVLGQFELKNSEQRKNARKKATMKLQRLGKNKEKLTEYELMIASNIIVPEDINVSWTDIGGLESIREEISQNIVLPILQKESFVKSKLIRPPKGVLLHGPPGCGKTLIAKATAKQSCATFINLDVSMLTDKWYGESQKLVSALFSLAEKLEPSIIFIDEIDSLLRNRSATDHEATAMMKAQFMMLWDGLGTDTDKIVVVMGATNRPQDIDNAILRRMPTSFKISLPDAIQREKILRVILEDENTEHLDFKHLSDITSKFSGSDLKESCRIASLYRVTELAKKTDQSVYTEKGSCELRPITMKDMESAIKNISDQK